MNLLLVIAGFALIAVIFVDLVQTTLTVNGSGFLSRRLAAVVRWPLKLWYRRSKSHHALAVAGPTVLLALFVVWFGLLWAAWTLVFAGGDASVLQSPSKQPADVGGLIYFVGFTIITLGVGDYAPDGALWQFLTVVASASGFFLVTMVITYAVPVVSAVVEKRQLASYIHAIGQSPRMMLERAWSGSDYSGLNSHLLTITQQIHRIEKQHLAYPVLHHFHSRDRGSSLPSAVAVLDETLSVLLVGLPTEQRPPDAVLLPARAAIDGLLDTLSEAFIRGDEPPPPPPELPDRLQPAQPEVEEAFPKLERRRRLLHSWLLDDGWCWR